MAPTRTLYADRSQYELFPREIRKGTADEGVFSYNTALFAAAARIRKHPHVRNFIEAVRGQADAQCRR